MQTFLPYKDFYKSVQSLDYKRLGKQRVEAYQILRVLNGISQGNYRNHPACKMWQENVQALMLYHDWCILEWTNRGFNNNMIYQSEGLNDKPDNNHRAFALSFRENNMQNSPQKPWWLGNEDFHRSHRSRLISKNEEFYLPKFPDDKGFNDSLYFWPDMSNRTFKIIIPKKQISKNEKYI